MAELKGYKCDSCGQDFINESPYKLAGNSYTCHNCYKFAINFRNAIKEEIDIVFGINKALTIERAEVEGPERTKVLNDFMRSGGVYPAYPTLYTKYINMYLDIKKDQGVFLSPGEQIVLNDFVKWFNERE